MNCSAPDGHCQEVLGQLYAYLDNEETTLSVAEIKRHLDECGPCLREADLEVVLKQIVHRSCACETAPATLRVRIMTAITQVSY